MSNRTLISRETGHLVYNAGEDEVTFFAEGSISLEMVEETVDLPSMIFGMLDKIPVGRMAKLKFIPQEFSTGAAQTLFPHRNLQLGDSIFGSTDKPMDIHTTKGKRVRLACVAVYKEPEIRGDMKKTVFGEVEFWGILAIGADPDALASFIAETSVEYPGADAFDQTRAITPAWICSWGASPFNAIDLDESGFSMKSTSGLVEDKSNTKGLLNVALKDYKLEVTFTPLNIGRAAVLARMGLDVPLGGRKSAAAADFTAQGTGAYLTAYGMVMVNTDPFQFDSEKRTAGKITLQSTKTISSGVRAAMLYLDTGD